MQFRDLIALLLLGGGLLAGSAPADEPVAPEHQTLLANYCIDCHSGSEPQAGVSLEPLRKAAALSQHALDDGRPQQPRETLQLMERVLRAVQFGQMPPAEELQPAEESRGRFAAWLDRELVAQAARGGTLIRRLNREEYRNTIRALLGFEYELPDGFPDDSEATEFDTLAEELVLSPPLMEAYVNVAADIADAIFPPQRSSTPSIRQDIAPDELVISYSSGSLQNGALRLASKCSPIMRSCTWPSKIEVRASGIYRLQVTASRFGSLPSNEPMQLDVRARDVSSADNVKIDSLRLLGSCSVDGSGIQTFDMDVELYRGQTVVFHFANAPLDSDKEDSQSLREVFEQKFAADPRYLAAWMEMVAGDQRGGFRGGLGWERVKRLLASDDLDVDKATLDSDTSEALLKRIEGNSVLFVETIAYDYYENGPALEIHGVTLEGPKQLTEGPAEREVHRLQARLLGERGLQTQDEWRRTIVTNLLTNAFRRPVDPATIDLFVELAREHQKAGNSWNQSIHLLLRAALMSPRFLYREYNPSGLDEYDLASRLAYFLTYEPPDEELLQLAAAGTLSGSAVLRRQTQRLLPTAADRPMIVQFIAQWLDVGLLDDLMPDARLQVSAAEQAQLRQEVEHFFAAMLRENRPLSDFIDPDFTYTSAAVAKKLYRFSSGFDPAKSGMQRVALARGGRYGGILGQAGVMMATANGVDTQPVIRGVWVLENILGNPPPPPPQAVPAITPDTSGATTPRELLAAHTTEDSCAVCHRKIDPLGFVLENFDAVGRWRDHYPVWKANAQGKAVAEPGAPVDARGTLPDGTPISDVVDLKRWIVAHIDQFSECLSQKLMTYATGRHPNYVERKEIAQIVARNQQTHGGFQDLLLALIESETFRSN